MSRIRRWLIGLGLIDDPDKEPWYDMCWGISHGKPPKRDW